MSVYLFFFLFFIILFKFNNISKKKEVICYSKRLKRCNAGRALIRESGSCFQQSSIIVNTSDIF